MEDKHTGSLGGILKQTVVTRERDNQTAQQTTSPLPVSPKPEHSAVTLTPAADYRMVYQDNALTQSRRSLDLIEQRCLYQIIWKVRQDYVEKGDVQRDLWDNMRITLTSKQLGEVTDSNHRNAAYYSLRKLREKTVEVNNDKEWFVVGLINYARLNRSTGLYEVEVSSLLMPYLVELAEQYTAFQLSAVMAMKSKYSQRLFEICCQYRNKPGKRFYLDIERMRDILQLGDKYRLYTDLRMKVLDIAQKEIKELFDQNRCDLWFEYIEDEETKKRKAYTRIWFQIHDKEGDAQHEKDLKNLFHQQLWIQNFVAKTIKKDKKYLERVKSALIRNPDLIEPIFNRLTRLQKDEEKASHAPLTRYIHKTDYKIL